MGHPCDRTAVQDILVYMREEMQSHYLVIELPMLFFRTWFHKQLILHLFCKDPDNIQGSH